MKLTDPLFFIAIIPPKEVAELIQSYKEDMAKRFFSKSALNSPPHITLHMPFRYPEKKVDHLKEVLSNFSTGYTHFNLQLNGFGSFPPRVIFVGVDENTSLELLQKGLLKEMRTKLNIFNGDYKERAFHPHLTIAFRDLKPKNFKQAWEEYEKLPLFLNFIASEFCLLKHNGKYWEVHNNFELGKCFI